MNPKVLCVCPIGIGNYLLFYPACAQLKQLRPDWSLHLLGLRGGIGQLARGDALWDGVHVFDPTQLKGNLPAQLRIVRELRRQRFDCALNFFPSNKWMYNLLPLLAGIGHRYGFAYPYHPLATLPFLQTRRFPVDTALHDLEQNRRFALHVAGSDSAPGEPRFPQLVGKEDRQWAHEYLKDIKMQHPVAIHPGSSGEHGMDAKRWPAERFGKLADRLCEQIGASGALVLGGPDEEPLKKETAAAMRQRGHSVEPVSLPRTAALLSLSTVALCNDSGLMHIASCQNTPTIGIFGPTDERRNGPVGSPSLVVRKNMDGFPLWRADNVGNRHVSPHIDPRASLLNLSVDDAWEQIYPWISTVTTGLQKPKVLD
jgi:ADP-heptose:LPS heptosyltransferase